MTDWNKLKVIDLKAALKERGLPQTGLKPALVARLTEAEIQDGSESEATIQDQEDDKHDASSAASPDTISTALPPSGLSTELLPSALVPEAQLDPSELPLETADVAESTPLPSQIEPADGGSELPPPQSPNATPTSQPVADSHASALSSVESQEVVEDRLKRKRRSQSPPISSVEATRKRLRTENALQTDEGVLITQGDVDWIEKHNATDAGAVNAVAQEVDGAKSIVAGPTIVDASKEEILVERAHAPDQMDVDGTNSVEEVEGTNSMERVVGDEEGDTGNDGNGGDGGTTAIDNMGAGEGKRNLDAEGTSSSTTTELPSSDISKSRDSRFTNLFPKILKATPLHPPPILPADEMEDEPDRVVSPARHPATSALYIRNFMRPLIPTHLQSHLAALATPPGQETDSEVIQNFYLDPIKTHAFVIFTNTSAASRVRNAFHDRIWPDEKTRKPLWVDFVPLEKAEEWIAEEMASNSSGRVQAKKWEVTYREDENRNVTVALEEVSALSHQTHPMRQPVGPGHFQAPVAPRGFPHPPLGPRGFANQPQVAVANVARLDQLFSSTTTKPVLYFKPVSKELANRRLDNIDAALSKEVNAGRLVSGEIHRYTFEDNHVLVDRGPEIFAGIRPPVRGGRGGGRGGGGGGGAFRPRGRYRERGNDKRYDSYRGERRDSRDDRRY